MRIVTIDRESEYTEELCERLRNYDGVMILPIVGQMRGHKGWPDRVIVSRDWQGLIEFKRGDNEADKLQENTIRKINANCFAHAFIVTFEQRVDDVTVQWYDASVQRWPKVRTKLYDAYSLMLLCKAIQLTCVISPSFTLPSGGELQKYYDKVRATYDIILCSKGMPFSTGWQV